MDEYDLCAKPNQTPTHYVTGKIGGTSFGAPTTSLTAAEQIAALRHARGFRSLQIHCYATGTTTKYRHPKGQ